MRGATDRGVAARTEQAFVAVVPTDAIAFVRQLAQHFENLAYSLRFTDVMTGDHNEVAGFGCVCSCGHGILLGSTRRACRAATTRAIRAITDSRSVATPGGDDLSARRAANVARAVASQGGRLAGVRLDSGDMAYKLALSDGRPVLKLSAGKVTLPGSKQIWHRDRLASAC
jgi:hypothetical protein